MTKTEWNPLAAMPMDREYEVYHVVNEDDCGMSDFHAHHYYEIYLYLTGNVNICVEEKLYQPKPYTLFIYPPGVMHRWIPRGGQERYERAYAYISKEFIEDLSTPDLPLERMLNEAITRRNYSYPLGCQTGTSVIGWIDEILHSYRSDDPADLHMNRCRMYMLLITVSRLFSSAVEETAALPARIRDIIFYINENISGPITLDTLAARFFVSKYYLLHTFKEYAGVSIHQYILKKGSAMPRLCCTTVWSPEQLLWPAVSTITPVFTVSLPVWWGYRLRHSVRAKATVFSVHPYSPLTGKAIFAMISLMIAIVPAEKQMYNQHKQDRIRYIRL